MGEQASIKEQLIAAGIREIHCHGWQDFSLRRVAAACGVSCAAPYKHFRDKQELIEAIMHHISQQWHARQEQVKAAWPGDLRRQLVEMALAYVRFLLENPGFRSIIMTNDEQMGGEQRWSRAGLSACSQELIDRYGDQVGMTRETSGRKTFVVRSLIYGAALMIGNGELPDNEQSFALIAHAIEREFELD